MTASAVLQLFTENAWETKPHLAALDRKLDLALDERSGDFFGRGAEMQAIKRDAHRLAASRAIA